MREIEFFVPGIARTSGSHKSFKGRITHAGDYTKAWMDKINWHAQKVFGQRQILHTGPAILEITVFLERPKGHYGTGRNSNKLKPSAPEEHLKKPDTTKLLRAAEDALTKVIWRDDSQVIKVIAEKKFVNDLSQPGVNIKIKLF